MKTKGKEAWRAELIWCPHLYCIITLRPNAQPNYTIKMRQLTSEICGATPHGCKAKGVRAVFGGGQFFRLTLLILFLSREE